MFQSKVLKVLMLKTCKTFDEFRNYLNVKWKHKWTLFKNTISANGWNKTFINYLPQQHLCVPSVRRMKRKCQIKFSLLRLHHQKRNSSFRLNSTEMPNDEKCGKKLSLCNPRPLLIYLQKLFFLEIKEEERAGGEKETTKTRTVYLEVQFLKRPK